MQKNTGRTHFKPGNEIGKETRIKPGVSLAKKYKPEYAASLLKYFKEHEGFPTVEEWAVNNDLAIRTVREWCANEEKYPLFASTFNQTMAIQKNKLLQNGLADKYNATLTKFLLMNNHGMSDKSTNDTTVTFNVDYASSEIDEESN
jgi:hypothetical protein